MRDHYEIETLEQLRAIADILRVRIIDLLVKRPMTVTQLGEEMGLAPAKVHYHVRELERVGLLELVETREKGGILEKYYQPIAHDLRVSKALLSAPSDEAQAALQGLLDQISGEYLQAFRHLSGRKDMLEDSGMNIGLFHLYLAPEESHTLLNQFVALIKPYEARRGIEGEKEIVLSLLSYPTVLPSDAQAKEKAAVQISNVWVVGMVGYKREELLKVRAEGRRLHISVIGMCHFASDISASLIDETIETFSIVGKLVASTEIKEVLKRKEEQR